MAQDTDQLPSSLGLFPAVVVAGLLGGGLVVALYGRAEFRLLGLIVLAIGIAASVISALEARHSS